MATNIHDYLWIAVLGGVMGFAYGFLIGANDVANAFASSVASKSVTLKQAVIIASIFEFSGAFFLGASVTSTIRSKVVDTDLYVDEPEILMLGMFTSLTAAVVMLFAATYFGLPVSTTHDIVGSIMGFSIAARGFDSVDWEVARKIFISWIASPLVSGFVAIILFGAVKYGVMRSDNPSQRAYNTFPIVLTIGLGIDLFYVLYKASSNFKSFSEDTLKLSWALPASFGAGALCGLLWLVALGPIARRRLASQKQKREDAMLEAEKRHENALEEPTDSDPAVDSDTRDHAIAKAEGTPTDLKTDDEGNAVSADKEKTVGVLAKFNKAYSNFKANTIEQDLHAQSMHENADTARIWEDGEKFDPDAEDMFSYIQVFTACLNSFAHGANDVSNTIAPLSAIIQIYQDGVVDSKSSVQKWVLAYGGIAIVLGLLLYGYKVMKSIGYKLTVLSPSRGATAELAASLTVVTASFLEIPVSSTQCIVGAVTGVALLGGKSNLDWKFLLRVCCGWVTLFFAAVVLSAGIFSFCAFSPSISSN